MVVVINGMHFPSCLYRIAGGDILLQNIQSVGCYSQHNFLFYTLPKIL